MVAVSRREQYFNIYLIFKVINFTILSYSNFSWQHRDRVAAISQLLYEENLRHSSAGEAAKEERKIADDQDEQLLQENEEINAQIAKTRELRLRKEAIIEEETIRHELKEYDKEKAIKNREMEDFIKEETKALENRYIIFKKSEKFLKICRQISLKWFSLT